MNVLCALGTMSGTSMDGVDIACLLSDGVGHVEVPPGCTAQRTYDAKDRQLLFDAVDRALEINSLAAWDDPLIARAAKLVTQRHISTIQEVLAKLPEKPACIGFHGQTVLHRPNSDAPSQAFTIQLGDGPALAQALAIPVVHDFRSADVAAGGQGAPLAPLYHQALIAARTQLPAAILNLGGIANITLITHTDPQTLFAADVGPANVFMDDLMRARAGVAFDAGGQMAAAGTADEAVVRAFFDHSFFDQEGPKSLDRYSFAAPDLAHLSTQDAMATLAELTIQSVVHAVAALPRQPNALFVAGGGVHNAFVMGALAARLPCSVQPLDSLGASAAMLEAEAFAYLAVRHLNGLPISYPTTTGVPTPMIGGRLARP